MLIDEIESDEKMPKTDILSSLYKLKSDVEDIVLQRDEDLQWNDLD